MKEEWGPWIEHDGKGCPCRGKMVEIERRNGDKFGPYIAYSRRVGFPREGDPNADSWVHSPKPRDIIRYRIRKPRALIELQEMIADLSAPIERVEE